jgi:hypothetical protein
MHSQDSSVYKYTQNVQKFSASKLTCITSHTRSLRLSSQEEIEIVKRGVAQVGSVVVCEVVTIGAHEKVENKAGRFVRLNTGDFIIGVMGHRYSTTSMYGGVPESGIELPREEPVDLLSAGGLIGECYAYPSYRGSPTKLRLVGLASQGGTLLEIHPRIMAEQLDIPCPLLLITGTSAGVGKTKFAAKLIHYLSHTLERQVAATKLTGAGNFDDLLNLGDAGAKHTFDFVDAGLVSTYGNDSEQVVTVAKGILNHLGEKKPEVIVAEFGGDIDGANVPAVLNDPEIREATRALILVPSDVMAAEGALLYLKSFSSRTYVGQPIKNPAASQVRAWNTIDRRLYDCENVEDLEDLVGEILGWGRKKDDQPPQTEKHSAPEEQGIEHSLRLLKIPVD